MGEKCLDRFGIGPLLSRRRGRGPAAKGIKAPRLDVESARLWRIGGYCCFCLGHIAVSNRAKRSSPLVVVGSLDGSKGFPDVGRIEPDQRVHSIFRPLDRFAFDLVKSPLSLRLAKRRAGSQKRGHGCEQQATNTVDHVHSPHGVLLSFRSAALQYEGS
jgi:hypothetical protein